jgi:carboxylesterase type B
MAMEWVRDNIESFGGDKHRITMAGQSAGAGLVDYYSYAYASDPIANGFVLQSGVAKGSSAPIDTATAQKSWLGLAGKLGCPNKTVSDETFHCMEGKPAADLVAGLGSDMTFVPVVDKSLVFEDYAARQSAKGGYIVGANDNEAGLLFMWYPTASPELVAKLNDVAINCPAAERASRALAGGHPTWRYRYFGDFPNLALSTKPPSGSYHMAEV